MTDHDYDYFEDERDDDIPYIPEESLCHDCHEDCAADVDCQSCGLKFWIRACQYGEGKKPWPKNCSRCEKGLPPLYEY